MRINRFMAAAGDVDVPEGMNSVFGGQSSSDYHLYLIDEIGEPKQYLPWFALLETLTMDDVVKLHINSPGGNMYTALQLAQALKNTSAEVEVSIEGLCASGATLFLTIGSEIAISPHAQFMFHTYSSAMYGKAQELYSHLDATRKWSRKVYDDYYKDLLTDEELERIHNGEDLWLDPEQIGGRIKTKLESIQKETDEFMITQQKEMIKQLTEQVKLLEAEGKKEKKAKPKK